MTVKIGVSLPDEALAAARQAVADGRASSVSAYIAEAIERWEQADSLARLLDDLDRELGEPSAADLAWARRALGLA